MSHEKKLLQIIDDLHRLLEMVIKDRHHQNDLIDECNEIGGKLAGLSNEIKGVDSRTAAERYQEIFGRTFCWADFYPVGPEELPEDSTHEEAKHSATNAFESRGFKDFLDSGHHTLAHHASVDLVDVAANAILEAIENHYDPD